MTDKRKEMIYGYEYTPETAETYVPESEYKRVLAALEEAERQLSGKTEELAEAQQTIARQRETLGTVKSLIPLMQDDMESPSLRHNTGNMIMYKINAALGEGAES